MSNKFALIIGNTEYSDPGLAQLTAPGKDAEDFARVLKDTEIGAFDDVVTLLNQPEYVVREAIDDFFNQKMPDDLLVLYFSGHGVRDELGALYLAVKNTTRTKLRATGIKSDYIREAMDQSRSRRQVLILDCCNSGAFFHGTKAAIGVSIGTATAFEGGFGRVILTASDSTQFAWEGDIVIGETDNSLFTHFLIEGFKGEADLDGDGRITADELYDFAYEKVRLATPKQTPSKFSNKQQGEIVLRQNIRSEDLKSVPLPPYLISAIESPDPNIRLGVVQTLGKMFLGKNIGLARSAKEALGRIAKEDDSRQASLAAMQILLSTDQAEQQATHMVAEHRAIDEPKTKPKSYKDHVKMVTGNEVSIQPKRESLVSQQRATSGTKFIQRWSALFWMTLGFPIGLIISWPIFWSISELTTGFIVNYAIVGAIGGLIMAVGLRSEKLYFDWKSIFWISLAWCIGFGIGATVLNTISEWVYYAIERTRLSNEIRWAIDDRVHHSMVVAIVYSLQGAISGAIGGFAFAVALLRRRIFTGWEIIPWLSLYWVIGLAIGFGLGTAFDDAFFNSLGNLIGNRIGFAIGAAISGAITIWQIRKGQKSIVAIN